MKKPLAEDISYPNAALSLYRRYTVNGVLENTLVNNAWRTAGGGYSTIRRSPGPKLPYREKGFTRTLVQAVKENGDIEWSTGGGINRRLDRLTGTFSGGSGGGWNSLSIVADYGAKSAAANAIFTKYALSNLAVSVDLRSQAEVKALNKLRDKAKVSDLDFGLLFGERRETAKLLRNVMVGTADIMRAVAFKDYRKTAAELKRYFGVAATPAKERRRLLRVERDLKKGLKRVPTYAERAVGGMEDAILGYNLGISPLVSDLKAGVAALSNPSVFDGFDITVKAMYSRTLNDEATWSWDGYSTTSTVTVADTHGYTVTLRCRPVWTTWALLSRLGIADLSLAWQLTSLTFLVDYHLAVGPWLSALNARTEFKWVDGSYTQRIMRNIRLKTSSSRKTGCLGRSSGYGIVNHTKRVVYTTMPLPAPPMSRRIRTLSSDDAQDAQAKRALNEAALASRWIRECIKGVFN